MNKEQNSPGRIKSSILRWLGVPLTLLDGTLFTLLANGAGSQSRSGVNVTADKALTLDAVWACVQLIAENIASLPLQLFRKDGAARIREENHWLSVLLHDTPNGTQTIVEFLQCIVASLLLWGNAFVRLRRIGDRIVSFEFLPPSRIGIRIDPNTRTKEISFLDYDGRIVKFGPREVWHIQAFSLDGFVGLSPITYGANMIGNALSATDVVSSLFRSGLISPYVFKIDKPLRKDQRQEYREALRTLSGAVNSGDAPLLEGGMDVKALGINPVDAQLLETRNADVAAVCRWFRVPPHMVGHTSGQTSWGAGIEAQKLGFLEFTLRAWLRRIEASIEAHLLTPAERRIYTAKFNVEGFLRADSKTRALIQAIYLDKGVLNRDEVRAQEERGPIPGGDQYTVQVNMTPLDLLRSLVEQNNSGNEERDNEQA